MSSRWLRALCTGLGVVVWTFVPSAAGFAVEEHHENVFDPWFEFARVLNFVLVAVGLFFLLRKPVRMAMARRRDGIRRAMREAEEAREEARRLREEYARRTADLERALEEIRAAAKAEQEEMRARILREGREAAERAMEQARFAIEQETKKAEQQIRARAALLALDLAEKALERELGPEDQRRLIQDYIARVGELN